MKLHKLYNQSETDILRTYLKKLRKLCEADMKTSKTLTESKITITIDTDEDKKPAFSVEAKNSFMEKAKAIGDFSNPEWVEKLLRSMKQSGVQGFNEICEAEKPVTTGQIQQLIALLVNLINDSK